MSELNTTPESTTATPGGTFEATVSISKEIQSRFRSKFAWVTLFSLIIFVLKEYFHFEIPKVDELVNYILIMASAFGIFNNPTDSKNY
jgi:hypothetical protein